MKTSAIDPVCGMEVKPRQNETIYLDIHYAFCSQQCRDRFLANPHLYIGQPGEKAPKQRGAEVIKKRTLRLAAPLPPQGAETLAEALQAMMGVKRVTVDDLKVEVTYDLLQATAKQIEERIAEIGVQLGEGWAESLRRAFVHYEEECEIGNLEVGEKRTHG